QAELPDLRPSARPQAWHSPENAAFREALGLPTDSSQQPAQAKTAPSATLADALRSAPTLLSVEPPPVRAPQPANSRGLVVVAVASFAAGILTAVIGGRLWASEPQRVERPHFKVAQATEPEREQAAPLNVPAATAEPQKEEVDGVLP